MVFLSRIIKIVFDVNGFFCTLYRCDTTLSHKDVRTSKLKSLANFALCSFGPLGTSRQRTIYDYWDEFRHSPGAPSHISRESTAILKKRSHFSKNMVVSCLCTAFSISMWFAETEQPTKDDLFKWLYKADTCRKGSVTAANLRRITRLLFSFQRRSTVEADSIDTISSLDWFGSVVLC